LKRSGNRGALSESFVAELPAREFEYMVWDRAQPTFGVRVYPTGHKSYVVRKRVGDEQTTLLLGRADVLPLVLARQEGRRLIVEIGDGGNPAEAVRTRRSTPSFEAMLAEFEERSGARWKPSTWVAHRKYVENWIRPGFAGAFIDEIDKAKVLEWFEAISRISPGGANRALSILSAMMAKAIAWGRLAGSNPCVGITTNPGRKVVRFLSEDELLRFGGALDRFAGKWGCHTAYLRFLLLTGMRKSEPLGLTWKQVGRGWVRLEDSKTGPRTLQLGQAAMDILAEQGRGDPKAAVFVFRGEPLKLKGVDWFWAKACKAADLPGLRIHDLRHNFASHAVMNGETLASVSKMLGHGSVATTARYAHLDDERLIEAAQIVGAALEQLLVA
jgi:integrase